MYSTPVPCEESDFPVKLEGSGVMPPLSEYKVLPIPPPPPSRLRWFFLLPQVVYSHACTDKCSSECSKGTFKIPRVLSLCNSLLSHPHPYKLRESSWDLPPASQTGNSQGSNPGWSYGHLMVVPISGESLSFIAWSPEAWKQLDILSSFVVISGGMIHPIPLSHLGSKQ